MQAIKNNVADIRWDSPGSNLVVEHLHYEEELSTLYRLQVDLYSPEKGISFGQMVEKSARIKVMCGANLTDERIFSGIITRFAQKRTVHGDIDTATNKGYRYSVEIRPKLWLATKNFASKVFQKQTAQDIVGQVLGDLGIACEWRVSRGLRERLYCLQYEESNFDFASRLLEEEGIAYSFDHEAGTVIFCDNPGAYPKCSPTSTAMYSEHKNPGIYQGTQEIVADFGYEESLGTGSFAMGDYNHETPENNLGASGSGSGGCLTGGLESYQHSADYYTQGDGTAYAGVAGERSLAQSVRAFGLSYNRSFEAGRVMSLKNHFRSECNRDWLLVSCRVDAQQGRYTCGFTAVPADISYRPAQVTKRPRVASFQTATVTGPAGSKVYLDELGRCKIQFHWDREGMKNDRSSMWVRVANGYAGKDYGIQWIPRVGHEVLIGFANGNPDHPFVAGRMYNQVNSNPLKPADKWKNIIKTIKDNHILFDDMDGKELVHVRAEKDMETLVIHDDRQIIGNNRTIKVGVDHGEAIGQDMGLQVGRNLSELVGVDHGEVVGQDLGLQVGRDMSEIVGQNHSEIVGNDMALQVGHNRIEQVGVNHMEAIGQNMVVQVGANLNEAIGQNRGVQVGKNQSVTIGKNLSQTVGKSYTQSVGKNMTTKVAINKATMVGLSREDVVGVNQTTAVGVLNTLNVGGNSMTNVGGNIMLNGGKKYSINIMDEVTLRVGTATVVIKKTGDIKIKGKEINVKTTGKITMKGSKIQLN